MRTEEKKLTWEHFRVEWAEIGDGFDTCGDGARDDKGVAQVSSVGGGDGLGRKLKYKSIVLRTRWCYLIQQNGVRLRTHQAYIRL